MRKPRLYLPQPLASGQTLALSNAAFNHAIRVLRLRAGAAVTLFNGDGGEFEAVLEHIDRRGASVRIVDFHARSRESPLTVRLLQGICRGDRMDYTLQKAVELGVTTIQPLLCERSPPPRTRIRLHDRQVHWHGVIASACEQCGRNTLPTLGEIRALAGISTDAYGGLDLVLDPTASAGLTGLAAPDGPLNLLVGPEGGLSDLELSQARTSGFIPLRLGPRILRTETAGLAALAAVQTLWGDLG